MDYFVLFFVLPAFILLSVRWLFPFVYAVLLGILFGEYAHREFIPPSRKTIFMYHDISGMVYLLALLCYIGIIALTVINIYYPYDAFLSVIIVLFKLFIIFYATWFLVCFTAGALFGRELMDGFAEELESKTVYYVAFDAYKNIINLPQSLFLDIGMIFDNERKIKERISVHKSMIPSYKKQGDVYFANALKEAVARNQAKLKMLEGLRKTHGHLFFFWRNFNKQIYKILFCFIEPIGLLYVLIIESFIILFPSLNKVWDAKLEEEKAEISKIRKQQP